MSTKFSRNYQRLTRYLASQLCYQPKELTVVTNMRERQIFQRGVEVGRASAISEMKAFEEFAVATVGMTIEVGKTYHAAPNAPAAKGATKAPAVARGVKRAARKDTGPRVRGVKDAIVNMIHDAWDNGRTVETADIIANTGFKANSVRGTLMTLKRDGIVGQNENKNWIPTGVPSGNGESAIASEYA